jgi:hypothetical protein
MRDHRHAVMPGGEEHVEEASHPCPVGRTPHAVAWLGKAEREVHPGQMAEERSMGQEGALRVAGRSGRIEEDCRVVSARVDDRECV